ncbi:MAG: MarC family protein [Polyangiaceae bacterium]
MTGPLAATLVAFGSVFSIVDPFTAVPVFVALVGDKSKAVQTRTAFLAAATCFATLTAFAAAGAFLFRFFSITIPAFKIAGGILLFFVAMEMMRAHPSSTRTTEEETAEAEGKSEVGLIPLGLPLLSGPGAIATVMVLVGKAEAPADRAHVYAAIFFVSVSAFAILRSASFMAKLLGQTGINLISRFMGLILAAIAVQFVLDGVHEAFPVLTR